MSIKRTSLLVGCIAAGLLLLAYGPAPAKAQVYYGGYGGYYGYAPAYYYPPPAYYAPPPVVYAPPVYVARPYCYPGWGFGGGFYYRGGGHGCYGGRGWGFGFGFRH